MYSKSNNNYPYKVCVVTAARSEYGLLQWLMYSLQEDKRFCLQLIVTGAHLSTEQGLTYKQIEEDGFRIDEKIEMLLDSGTSAGIVKSTGLCAIGMADCLQRLKPDIIVVLGDRYELLPVCTSALLFNIPIAHISGGDITEGAIDNEIRNAVTMMSSLHFPEVESSANRIINMIGTEKNVYTVGETGLESFMRYSLITRSQLSADLNLSIESDWVLLTYHPETKLSIEQNLRMGKIVACPTAGSCGIVPAVIKSMTEAISADIETEINALLTAGIIGEIISNKLALAGAVMGCQSECGVAAAMAAGAMVEIYNGTSNQILNAAALTLKNVMGLVCDPVAGLVEVPCVKRNAFLAIYAVTAAEMAMAGIQSVIPIDEVVDAMKQVGELMNPCLKESSEGGLATTKTGLRITQELSEKWKNTDCV